MIIAIVNTQAVAESCGTKKEVEREGEGTNREEGLQDLEVDEGTVE